MMRWEKLISSFRSGDTVTKKLSSPLSLRNRFEQDYDRVIFSYPFRRMQDKTQVFPLPETDFVHTRLTHSLEVSAVARSLGQGIGETILSRHPSLPSIGITPGQFGDITGTAALAHDIGNPPFGHSGEESIGDFFIKHDSAHWIRSLLDEKQWKDITSFEGNAQGFRLLNKKNFQGLNLTMATLAAFTKYPRESVLDKTDPERRSQKKFGFFQSERIHFSEVATQTGLISLDTKGLAWCRHPLAFLVEAADDICYSIIDLEDGCNMELIRLEDVMDLLLPIIPEKYNQQKFKSIQGKREKAGLLRALTISTLVEEVIQAFLDLELELLSGKFDKALTSVIPSSGSLKSIIEVSIKTIYRSPRVLEREAVGFEVLNGLMEAYIPALLEFLNFTPSRTKRTKVLLNLLPAEFRDQINPGSPLYENLMLLLDYISGMTDTMAVKNFRLIRGISLI